MRGRRRFATHVEWDTAGRTDSERAGHGGGAGESGRQNVREWVRASVFWNAFGRRPERG
jgi:hypothetical protein